MHSASRVCDRYGRFLPIAVARLDSNSCFSAQNMPRVDLNPGIPTIEVEDFESEGSQSTSTSETRSISSNFSGGFHVMDEAQSLAVSSSAGAHASCVRGKCLVITDRGDGE